MRYSNTWSVFIYAMMLVILWMYMALAVQDFSRDLDSYSQVRDLDMHMSEIIRGKTDIAFKYARRVNQTGSGFTDTLGCPQDITFSWSTLTTTGSILRYASGSMICEWVFDGNNFQVYFNDTYTDTSFLQYNNSQIVFNSWSSYSWSIGDIYIDQGENFSLNSDDIDDNFDSDNYSLSSTWAVMYPDWYIDNDADARFLQFGYAPPSDDWYNVLWINQKVLDYIDENTHNISPWVKLSEVGSGRVYMDINRDFDIQIYKLDRKRYSEKNELVIKDWWTYTGTGSRGIGYIQENTLQLAGTGALFNDPTWEEFVFDFTSDDYAIFIKNTDPNQHLLYQIRVETETGSWVYLVPMHDHEPSILSMLGNHIIHNPNDQTLIGTQYEITQLK